MELVPYAMSTFSRNPAGASDEQPLRLVPGWGTANDCLRRQSNHPSRADAGDGITIYADPRFKGPSYLLFTDVEDLDDVKAECFKTSGFSSFNFDDCISSIRVPPGLKVTVCEDPHYRGASVTFTSDVADLDDVRGPCGEDFDDCISSIRVSRQ